MAAAPVQCPRCGAERTWLLKDGRRRCAACRYDWTPGRLPLRLTDAQWRALLVWFVRGAPSAAIARETGLDRKRVLRALLIVREAMWRSRATHFRSAVRAPERAIAARRHAVIGLRIDERQLWAEIIPGVDAEQLGRGLHAREGSSLMASGLPFAAIVYRGRLFRLGHGAGGRVPFGRIEAFWSYLQRQLRAKGGIRRQHLNLYLAAFSWRYNHRKLSPAEQVRQLLELIGADR